MSKPSKRRQAKKKAREKSLRKRKATRHAPRTDTLPPDDPYLGERAMRRILLVHGEPFPDSPEAMEAVMASVAAKGEGIDNLALGRLEADPIEKAQELAFQALSLDLSGPSNRADRLAEEALALDPDCSDARLLLTVYQDDSDGPLEEEVYRELQALRARSRQRLEAQYGADFWEHLPEILRRPHHRLLAALLDEANRLIRRDDAMDLALEAARLGPSSAMDPYGTLSWLLAGGHGDEAEELMERFEDGIEADRLDDGMFPDFLWWRSWSAFQAGNLEEAQELAFLAEEYFQDSALFLFVETKEEDQVLLDSPFFSDNLDRFGNLLDAMMEPDPHPFKDAGRVWFAMDEVGE